MSPPKLCAVCGDKALGYNFNAVTCESCKAFFRRNALAKKQFTCPFNQNCDMTVVTRRFCQKCRLKKCLDIGMKSENIMSEEDKMIKRRKIESNRAKRRVNEGSKRNDDKNLSGSSSGKSTREDAKEDNSLDSTSLKREHKAPADSSGGYEISEGSRDSHSNGSFASVSNASVNENNREKQPSSSTSCPSGELLDVVNPDLMTSEEMVEFIVADPDRASQAISRLMRTRKEAMSSLEKIINSQKDALRLISHLIAYPGDALKIISKIMNSPFNALTVFTKFMSSPTDALEIISKIVSSPQDVLQFIKNLMDSPEDALDIMNKFMNTPAEALKILNKIFNGPNPSAVEEIHNDILSNNTSIFESQSTAFQTSPPMTPPSVQIQIPLESETTHGTDTLLHSMLQNSPNSSASTQQPFFPPAFITSLAGTPSPQSMSIASPLTPQSITTNNIYTPSPQTLSVSSPLSVATTTTTLDMQYNSPTTSINNDELPSTSAGLLPPVSPTNIANEAAEFANEHFDLKTFIQNSFPDNPTPSDSMNSLESVLTEVIRIEFQAFNSLQPEPRIKQEYYGNQFGSLTNFRRCGASMNENGNEKTTNYWQGYNAPRQTTQPICAPSSIIMGRDLNEAELLKLRELKLASEALYYPVDDDLSGLMMGDERIKPGDTYHYPKLLQVINLTAVAIKRLIKMAKKITGFRDMCQEDQVALLKGGCTEMMIMRSVMTYDNNRNTWKIPHTKEDMSNIRAEVLKLAKGNVYEEHLKFISTFDEKWRMDENIILIMCAIVLFMPTRPRIVHSDVIKLEQNSYYYLLRRYLESVYSGCEAKSAFIKLIQKISDVERLNQVIIGVYLNVNPAQVEPLLREIFDLKNNH